MNTYAIITGGSKGIGKAIAEQLADRKYNIILVSRSEKELAAAANNIRDKYSVEVDYSVLDLSDTVACQKLYNWVKQKQYQVSILVNNAGYGLSGNFDKYSVEELENMLQLNVLSLTKLTRIFLPELIKQKSSYILNVGSTASYQAVPYLSLYSASKAFVLFFSRGLYQELRGTNVSVTCVCPGPTDTYFIERAQVGEKGLKTAEKVNMTSESVAQIAVKALFNRKPEVVTGFLNKLGVFMAWLLPKSFVERTAMKIYQ